jgi:hypothetical protein
MPDDATKSCGLIADRSTSPLGAPAVLVEPPTDLGRVEADVVAPLDVRDALLGDEALDVPGLDAEQRSQSLDVEQRVRQQEAPWPGSG